MVPVNPAVHSHVASVSVTLQLPPFWQGFGSQLGAEFSQVSPVNPEGHSQVKVVSEEEVHTPSFWHGEELQGSDSALGRGGTGCESVTEVETRLKEG